MERLFSYIGATQGWPSPVSLEGTAHRLIDHDDDLAEVRVKESLYRFSNGVELLYRCEQEQQQSDDQLCAECWISYQVLNNNGFAITPSQKSFSNVCQQRFWLKMQAGQQRPSE
ncbi:hypothetical protein [Ferrimonas futtsuensis]|uniref:hypothetical protein n=1 Tax=Ferrimonas futtsuensis TaxID=364764 RepID=UPI00040E4DCE|nr:hypothetical protein [Ferrimonas futtsuensis]